VITSRWRLIGWWIWFLICCFALLTGLIRWFIAVLDKDYDQATYRFLMGALLSWLTIQHVERKP
jgi:Na+/melibiose symporter-like transporter